MIQTIKMAYRDLGRNRRRSFFSALALGMGLALLLLIASVVKGEYRGAMDSSIQLQTGDLQVMAKTYDENKTSLAWEDLVANPDQIAAQIGAMGQVLAATPRLYASGIAGAGNQSVGVRIIGIDPNSAGNDIFHRAMTGGEYLTADDRSGVLMGQTLAKKLGLKPGDSIDLLVNTANGNTDEQIFTVRGIFNTHTPGFDQGSLFMPLAKAQAFTGTENHASVINVLLKNIDDTGPVAAALTTSQYRVQTYLQANQILADTEAMANSYMAFLYLIVLAITATVIVNTLMMAVFERTREIGILSAIGMKASRIMAMFFAESGLLAVGGILMGLVLGSVMVALATRYGFYIGDIGMTGLLLGDRIYAYPAVSDGVVLTVATFIVALLAALYPAVLAARLEPVQALHSGD